MKCLILAAGYATRLYPLTENFPKPLLEIKGKTIIDWLIDDVERSGLIDTYYIVSNHKFISCFEDWREQNALKEKIILLDDGSTENNNRLGAVKDIAFAIDQEKIADDLLVLAGDNLLDFSLNLFVDFFQEKQGSCVMRYYEESKEKLQRTGVATIDEQARIIEMQEKPKEPKSNWAIPPFYLYQAKDLPWIAKGIAADCDTDAPGNFIAWFCQQCDVFAFEMPGSRYDIGNLQSLEEIRVSYQGIVQ